MAWCLVKRRDNFTSTFIVSSLTTLYQIIIIIIIIIITKNCSIICLECQEDLAEIQSAQPLRRRKFDILALIVVSAKCCTNKKYLWRLMMRFMRVIIPVLFPVSYFLCCIHVTGSLFSQATRSL
jgi:hypothetical protein